MAYENLFSKLIKLLRYYFFSVNHIHFNHKTTTYCVQVFICKIATFSTEFAHINNNNVLLFYKPAKKFTTFLSSRTLLMFIIIIIIKCFAHLVTTH